MIVEYDKSEGQKRIYLITETDADIDMIEDMFTDVEKVDLWQTMDAGKSGCEFALVIAVKPKEVKQ
jgi:hypothetical protein